MLIKVRGLCRRNERPSKPKGHRFRYMHSHPASTFWPVESPLLMQCSETHIWMYE